MFSLVNKHVTVIIDTYIYISKAKLSEEVS